MRRFIDIIAESAQTMALYRGDNSHVDKFDISKTDAHALFGAGIYLTSDRTVARDYSFARTYDYDSHRMIDTQPTQKSLVVDYLYSIIRNELKWSEDKDKLLAHFRELSWTLSDEEKAGRDIREEFSQAVLQSFGEKLKQAKKIYRQRSANMVFVRSTLGNWKLLRKDWKGVISHFEVPVGYIAKCLNGETPLSDAAIQAIRNIIYARWPDGYVDFRDDENHGTPFANWLDIYRTKGTRYAWSGDIIGGNGTNPTLDHLMNGTLAGFHIRKECGAELLDRFKQLGYVGIEYAGGARVGGYNRGGGGVSHRAFVFWDDSFINSCRVKDEFTAPDDADDINLSAMRPKSLLKNYRDKI